MRPDREDQILIVEPDRAWTGLERVDGALQPAHLPREHFKNAVGQTLVSYPQDGKSSPRRGESGDPIASATVLRESGLQSVRTVEVHDV